MNDWFDCLGLKWLQADYCLPYAYGNKIAINESVRWWKLTTQKTFQQTKLNLYDVDFK